MDERFIVLGASEKRDPDGARLTSALQSHYKLERARALRQVAVYVLAGLGALAWFAVAWPTVMSVTFTRVVVSAWVVAFFGLVLAVLSEIKWYWRRAAVLPRIGLKSTSESGWGPGNEGGPQT